MFSAKILCTIPINPLLVITPEGLVPGIYRTAINIHNPDPVRPVKFTKIVITSEGPLDVVGVYTFKNVEAAGP